MQWAARETNGKKTYIFEVNWSALDLDQNLPNYVTVHKDETDSQMATYRALQKITRKSRWIIPHLPRKGGGECYTSQEFHCGSESLHPITCLSAYFQDCHSPTDAQFLGPECSQSAILCL